MTFHPADMTQNHTLDSRPATCQTLMALPGKVILRLIRCIATCTFPIFPWSLLISYLVASISIPFSRVKYVKNEEI